MELFKVVNREGKVETTTSDKMEAKAVRDALNGATNDKAWRVSRGKDNLPSPRGYAPKMRRQPK